MHRVFTRLGSVLVVLAAGAAGCDSTPLDQPDSALPALQLHARLGEPAPETAERFAVQLAPIPYCPAIDNVLPAPVPPAPLIFPPYIPLDRSAADLPFTAYSSGYLGNFGCGYSLVPVVRFFEPWLFFDPVVGNSGPPVPWTPRGTIVAYANGPIRVQPFGPDDEPIHLPAGYSVLKRSCGTKDKPWRVERADASDPIDFYPSLLPNFYPQPRPEERVLREQNEGLLLDGCPIERPALEPGTRLNFDRATSLQFSADGAEVLYLVAAEPGDPERAASIRSVNVTTGTSRQVAAIRDGLSFHATTRPGVLYAMTQTGAVEIDVQNDGPPRIAALPFRSLGSVSPDGRWLMFWDNVVEASGSTSLQTVLWDVDSGTSRRLVDSILAMGYRWTPGSQLYRWSVPTGEVGGAIVVVSPLDLQEVRSIPIAVPALVVQSRETYWDGEAPYVFTWSAGWTPIQKESWPDLWGSQRGVGAVVGDPTKGGSQQVIAPSAGEFAFAAGGPGAAFLWTHRCQGLFETVCTFALHRVTVPGLEDRVVAVADTAAPVAVSPSGDRVAIATRDGIFVRSVR